MAVPDPEEAAPTGIVTEAPLILPWPDDT